MLNFIQNFLFLYELKVSKEREITFNVDLLFHLFVRILEILKSLQLAYKAKTTHLASAVK